MLAYTQSNWLYFNRSFYAGFQLPRLFSTPNMRRINPITASENYLSRGLRNTEGGETEGNKQLGLGQSNNTKLLLGGSCPNIHPLLALVLLCNSRGCNFESCLDVRVSLLRIREGGGKVLLHKDSVLRRLLLKTLPGGISCGEVLLRLVTVSLLLSLTQCLLLNYQISDFKLRKELVIPN